MLSRLTVVLYSILFTALIVKPIAVKAETVTIPIFLDYQQFQLLMIRDNFEGPNNTVQYLLDDSGCTSITFSEPRMSTEGELLRVDAKIFVTIGVPAIGSCKVITRWT